MVVNAVVLVLVPDLTVTEAVVYPVAAAWAAGMPSRPAPVTAVSYTHLTLPTILLV